MGVVRIVSWIVSASVLVSIMATPVVIEELYNGLPGTYLLNSQIGEQVTVETPSECLLKCQANNDCLSVNTMIVSDTVTECVLNNEDSTTGAPTSNPGDKSDVASWMYWEKN